MKMCDKWSARASRLICVALVLLGVYLAFKYAVGIFLPFLAAWAIGAAVSFLAGKSAKKFKGSKKCWRVFYIALFWGIVFLALLAFVIRLGVEATEFLSAIEENSEAINEKIKNVIDKITALPSKIPFLEKISSGEMFGKMGEYIKKAASGIIDALVKQGGAFVAQNLGKLATRTPKVFMGSLICVISSIYLSLDYDKIKLYFKGLIEKYVSVDTLKIFSRVSGGVKAYLKAYFTVFLITFGELYLGLAVLGRKYALLIAFFVAAFDILPLFGAGAVLVPWGTVLIASGSIGVGIGMLVLFVIMTVVRQIVEPHLVGKHLGIHPLASLVSVYVGYRIFGLFGMLLAPFAALAVKGIFDGEETNKKDKKIEEKT